MPELAASAVKRSEEQWKRNMEVEVRSVQLEANRQLELALTEVRILDQHPIRTHNMIRV